MNWTILLVDDDPLILQGIQGALRPLEQETARIWTSQSALEAIEILNTHPVDLIITDENMEGMKGTELLAWLSKHHPETRRIILTGDHSLAFKTDPPSQAAADAHLTKPFKNCEILTVVSEVLIK
jgi:CheY-like chemotaxis protein